MCRSARHYDTTTLPRIAPTTGVTEGREERGWVGCVLKPLSYPATLHPRTGSNSGVLQCFVLCVPGEACGGFRANRSVQGETCEGARLLRCLAGFCRAF